MSEGPYTTITVDEFNQLSALIRELQKRLDTVRELLKKGSAGEALRLLQGERKENGSCE